MRLPSSFQLQNVSPIVLALVYLATAVVLRWRFRNRFTFALMVMVLFGCSALLYRDYRREFRNAFEQARAAVTGRLAARTEWPPKVGDRFPDLTLYDQDGNLIRLSSLAGKVLLVEPVGMSCPACVAFSGGNLYGPFDGVPPQADLEPIHEYVKRYGAVRWTDGRFAYVQLLLFDRSLGVPTPDDARRWANHFRFETADRNYVLAGGRELHNDTSRRMIPGFFLIDKDFVVRADSSGPTPSHDLYSELIPMLHDLLDETEVAAGAAKP
ncbi:MAG: hypothetical protein FJ297_08575 [Planctomycetes bacterium]|nr:hypothetical protein [Planctomycetota bacterium]